MSSGQLRHSTSHNEELKNENLKVENGEKKEFEVQKNEKRGVIDLENSFENSEIHKIETAKIDGLRVENRIYRERSEKLEKELADAQKRIEAASYRVGQLEGELKNSIPLLDFRAKTTEIERLKFEKALRETKFTREKRALERFFISFIIFATAAIGFFVFG